MARGQEENSTSQVGRKRGTPQESPVASNLVTTMFVEELRSFCQVPADISLELSDGVAVSTVGGADNVVYFTREQFGAKLFFPFVIGEAVLALYPSTTNAHTSKHLSDLDGLHCAELSLPVGYFTGRYLFYIHFKA